MSLQARNRVNVILLTLVVALAVFAYFRPTLKSKDSTQQAPLLAASGKVAAIRIALSGKPEVDLARSGDNWRLTAPLQWPADAATIQGVLDTMQVPVSGRFAARGADLSQYGLDKPSLRLWLDGREYDFGDVQPVSKQRYVLAGGEIELVDDFLYYRVAHDAYWWLDKGLVPEGARVVAVQLPGATLTQNDKGIWQMAPADKAVTAEALGKLVQAWAEARAMSIAPLGKGKAQGEVALSLAGEKQPLRYEILQDPDYFVLARPDLGWEYQLDAAEADALLKPARTPAPAAGVRSK